MSTSAILEQTTFSTGEISPALYARIDLQRYSSGLRLCRNMFVKAEGGVSKRPGTKFVAPTKANTGGIKLIPFQPTTDSTYVIEMGDQYARFHQAGSLILETASTTVTSITDASGNAQFNSAGHTLSNGDQVVVSDNDGVQLLYGRHCEVASAGANDFQLIDWETGAAVTYDATMAASTALVLKKPYEISTPYSEADVADVKYAQSVDVVFLAHPSYPPQKLTRTALTPTFSIERVFFNLDRLDTPAAVTNAAWWKDNNSGAGTFPNGYSTEAYVITTVNKTVGESSAESLPSPEFVSERDASWADTQATSVRISLPIIGTNCDPDSTHARVYKRRGGVFLFIGEEELSSGALTEFRDRNFIPAVGAPSPPEENDFFSQTIAYSGASGAMPSVGQVATGSPSGATARVIQIEGAGIGSGTIVVTPLTGQILDTDTITTPAGLGSVTPANVDTVTVNYPSTVSFFEDRLCWANSATAPQTVWMSQSGDYQNLSVSQAVVASDAVEFTINSRQLNAIYHMAPLDDLLLMTSGAVWAASGSGESAPIAPDSIKVRVQSYNGAEDVQPLFFDDSIIYVEEKAQTIRDLHYEFTYDRYTGSDLSVMSRHLFDGRTVVDWAHQKIPFGLVWTVMNDGKVLTLTYLREHDVRGWTRHEFAQGVVAITSISGSSEDDVYMVVTRPNGRRHIDVLQSRLYGTDIEDAWFVDGGATGSIYSGRTVFGLWHLEGQTVSALVDGSVETGLVVANGQVTLTNAPTSKVIIGEPFTAELTTLDINVSSAGGSLQAQRRKVSKIFVRVNETRGIFGAEDGVSPLNELKQQLYVPDQPIDNASGVIEIVPSSEWSRQGRVHLEFPYPLPAEVTAIMPEMVVGS